MAKRKVELIEDIDVQNRVSYYVRVNGDFVSGSVTSNKEDAMKNYENIVAGQIGKQNVLVAFEYED